MNYCDCIIIIIAIIVDVQYNYYNILYICERIK